MKEISDRTVTAFSDAALMIRYHNMLLSKAAESDRCRGGQSKPPKAPTGAVI